MKSSKIVFGNMGILFSKRFIEFLFRFLFIIFIARRLGVEKFGEYSFAVAFTMLFIGLADFGLYRYVNREVARDIGSLRDTLGRALFLKSLLSAISLLGIVFAVNLLGYEGRTRMLTYILGLAMIVYSYQLLFSAIFRGSQRMKLEFISTWSEKPILLVSSFLALKIGFGALSIAWLLLATRLMALSLSVYFYLKNYARPALKIERLAEYLGLLKSSLPYGIAFILGIVYIYINTIMLSHMKGEGAVGIYQVVIGLAMFLTIFPESITQSIFPRMTEYFYGSKRELALLYNRTMKLLAFFAFPIAAFFIFLNNFIISITFGGQYAKSAAILPVIGCMIIFMFFRWGTGGLLTAAGLQKTRTIMILISTALNILLNLILIPRFSYAGAAATALFTNLFAFSSFYFISSKRLAIKASLTDLSKFIISFIVMCVFLALTPGYNAYLRIVVSSAIFLLLLWRLKMLTRDEIGILKNIIFKVGTKDLEAS